MGVNIPYDELNPKLFTGEHFDDHCELAQQLDDKVICVDVSQWILQSCDGHRSKAYAMNQVSNDLAWKKSAITLMVDRVCIQCDFF
jgi:hypothetical protein